MPTLQCPNCRQRVVVSNRIGDFVHDCRSSGDAFLSTESKVNMGSFQNEDGTSGTIINSNLQGLGNELQGTLPGEVEGKRVTEKNIHGDNPATHRITTKFQYIQLDKNE